MENNDQAAEAFERAERTKLGEKGEERIRAVETYLKGKLDPARYEAFRKTVTTAAAIETIENHMRGAPSQSGPDKIPGYATMTFEQRRAAQWNRNGAA